MKMSNFLALAHYCAKNSVTNPYDQRKWVRFVVTGETVAVVVSQATNRGAEIINTKVFCGIPNRILEAIDRYQAALSYFNGTGFLALTGESEYYNERLVTNTPEILHAVTIIRELLQLWSEPLQKLTSV